MRARVLGAAAGGVLGAIVGTGTGIVGGPFGAVAGFSVFTVIGALWGLSAGPDIANQLSRWWRKSRQNDR